MFEGDAIRAAWDEVGFNALFLTGLTPLYEQVEAPLHDRIRKAAESGADLFLEVDPARLPLAHPFVADRPEHFAVRHLAAPGANVDPRRPLPATGEALARLGSSDAAAYLAAPVLGRLGDLVELGVRGFRLRNAELLGEPFLSILAAAMRERGVKLVAGPFADRTAAMRAGRAGLDYVISSFEGWDGRSSSVVEEAADLRGIAPLLASLREDERSPVRALLAAPLVAEGVIVPAHLLQLPEVRRAARQATEAFALARRHAGELRQTTGSAGPIVALARGDAADLRQAASVLCLLLNTTATDQDPGELSTLLQGAGAPFGAFTSLTDDTPADARLCASGARLVYGERRRPIESGWTGTAEAASRAPRLVLEAVSPSVDGGALAVKRVSGDPVEVDAVAFADGHEKIAVELRWKAVDEQDWRAERMRSGPDDRWSGSFTVERLGRYVFEVEAWIDVFAGYRRDLAAKVEARVVEPVDIAEGLALVGDAVRRTQDPELAEALKAEHAALHEAGDEERATRLLGAALTGLMARADDRPHRLVSAQFPVICERLAARFSSWYELFPRSQTDDADRHGGFADVVARLPAIRAMGFDTLYFPPIHPIGRTNRKGRNNALKAEEGDPGSPYAIGSAEGGHDAVHPELGSLEDFENLVAAAHEQGLEIALDFAIQASPDHPWLREHPGWFAWRPDGSMKYAENPPKKYQDIVNVDFYAPDAKPDLWLALRDVVLFWISRGVKTFRVDNPHTKPLPFWEWMIRDVQAAHPDAIFLAEAFTRPAMMYRLAKIGFSQSYTYFTWRDRKQELTDYIVELTTTEPKEFYRPHFFVNTPDINPVYLQSSGRAGFRVRAVLAATLSGLFGVYSGFELCEAAPLPGKAEEYLDSEKYEIRPRDWNAPGNIIEDITLLNRLRRAHPALQTHLNTRFYVAHNENILWYGKTPRVGDDLIMVMVNLDPHHAQEADFEVPLWEFGLPDDGAVNVEDLNEGHRFEWRGKMQHIRIAPDLPYRIWRLSPGGAS